MIQQLKSNYDDVLIFGLPVLLFTFLIRLTLTYRYGTCIYERFYILMEKSLGSICLLIQLHNWTFFIIFIRKIVEKSWPFFHFTFFPGEKNNFSSFHFSIQKLFFSHILCTTFFPVKKILFHGFEME